MAIHNKTHKEARVDEIYALIDDLKTGKCGVRVGTPRSGFYVSRNETDIKRRVQELHYEVLRIEQGMPPYDNRDF